MLRARTMIPWSLLMAACALAVVVNLLPAAQAPQNQDPYLVPFRNLEQGQKLAQAAAERPHPFIEKLEKLIKAKPIVAGSVDDELRKLLIARHEAAVRMLDADLAYYKDGRISIDRLLPPIRLIRDVELELSDNPGDHLPILELVVDLAKEFENRELAEEKLGRGSVAEVELARYHRFGAEIDLLRAKRKLAKK